jgi:hypothetical protein
MTTKMTVKLFVGMPCYGGQMHCCCTKSILELHNKCTQKNIEVKVDFIYNESLITTGRNQNAYNFLNSDYTHLLFIDSDIEFEADDVIKMLEVDKDIIGGIYGRKEIRWDKIEKCVKSGKSVDCLKYNTSEIPLHNLNTFGINDTYKINEPFEVKGIATGMMLIKRCVFEKMKEAFLNRYYMIPNNDMKIHCFFHCDIEGGSYLSEDYYFCHKWRELGGKVYAALWTRTVHYGNMGIYTDLVKKTELIHRT